MIEIQIPTIIRIILIQTRRPQITVITNFIQ